MNVAQGETFDRYGTDPLIDTIAEVLGTTCDINLDQNCSMSELANLLVEIMNAFNGDAAGALAAIAAGELQFEEIHHPEGDYWEWHIKAVRQ
jgi:hypothetical protein